ncbi:MAG: type 4a pilus biogenesis protein PilO [Rhodoglobus sp.]
MVLLAGWFLGVSPILDQVTATNAQTDSVQQANAATTARLANLKKQFAKMSDLQKKLLALQESIPSDAAISNFLAEINALCAANGVTLNTLTVNDALTYVAPGTPATPTVPADPNAQTAPKVDPATGLVAIPVSVSVSGPYAQVMSFAGALQTGTRLFFVSKLSVIDAGDGNVAGQIEGNIYALPLPGGTPTATPTPTPTPTPTDTAVPTDTPSPDPTENTDG